MPKVRTQIYLTEEQHKMLRDLSDRRKKPIALMIRLAVDQYLAKISLKERTNPLRHIVALGKSGNTRSSLEHDEQIYSA